MPKPTMCASAVKVKHSFHKAYRSHCIPTFTKVCNPRFVGPPEFTKCTRFSLYLISFTSNLELGQIKIELLRSLIDASELDNGLDALGTNAKAHIAVELFGEESLPLQIDLLDLLDASVGKCNNTGLTIGRLSQQVADARSHN